jgi:hypothetical protein
MDWGGTFNSSIFRLLGWDSGRADMLADFRSYWHLSYRVHGRSVAHKSVDKRWNFMAEKKPPEGGFFSKR